MSYRYSRKFLFSLNNKGLLTAPASPICFQESTLDVWNATSRMTFS